MYQSNTFTGKILSRPRVWVSIQWPPLKQQWSTTLAPVASGLLTAPSRGGARDDLKLGGTNITVLQKVSRKYNIKLVVRTRWPSPRWLTTAWFTQHFYFLFQNPIDNLPSDLRERATQLFQCAMKYAVEMLTWEEEDQLPEDIRQVNRNSIYITMLFNDEVHTYEQVGDRGRVWFLCGSRPIFKMGCPVRQRYIWNVVFCYQVIQTLQRAVDCTHKEAIDFATTVDREVRGALLLKSASYSIIFNVRNR